MVNGSPRVIVLAALLIAACKAGDGTGMSSSEGGSAVKPVIKNAAPDAAPDAAADAAVALPAEPPEPVVRSPRSNPKIFDGRTNRLWLGVDVTGTDDQDYAKVWRMLRRETATFVGCYQAHANGARKVEVTFVVPAAGGAPEKLVGTSENNEVAACLTGWIGKTSFPPLHSGAAVSVAVLLSFRYKVED